MGRWKCASAILAVALAVSGCAKVKEYGELENGYGVFALSAREIYVVDSSKKFLLGPATEIGVSGDIVVVQESSTSATNGFQATPEFSVLNTRSGEIEKNVSESEIASVLMRMHVVLPEMKPSSSFLTRELP